MGAAPDGTPRIESTVDRASGDIFMAEARDFQCHSEPPRCDPYRYSKNWVTTPEPADRYRVGS